MAHSVWFQKNKPLPHKRVASMPTEKPPYFHFVQVELLCRCLMPETFNDMVECEKCEDMFLHRDKKKVLQKR